MTLKVQHQFNNFKHRVRDEVGLERTYYLYRALPVSTGVWGTKDSIYYCVFNHPNAEEIWHKRFTIRAT